jgi:hypothetical protein
MHLRRVLKSYAAYNNIASERSLNTEAPVSRPIQRTGAISHAPSFAAFTTTHSRPMTVRVVTKA